MISNLDRFNLIGMGGVLYNNLANSGFSSRPNSLKTHLNDTITRPLLRVEGTGEKGPRLGKCSSRLPMIKNAGVGSGVGLL